MRKTIMQIIGSNAEVLEAIPLDNWHQASDIDTTPVKPFGVYRLSGTGPGVTRSSPSKEVRLELWIHDVPGSYLRIDKLLSSLESTFNAVVHASAAEGESISQTAYESRSPDLDDSGFGSICKATIYTLIGKGQ
jgi:hypothetical protein